MQESSQPPTHRWTRHTDGTVSAEMPVDCSYGWNTLESARKVSAYSKPKHSSAFFMLKCDNGKALLLFGLYDNVFEMLHS
jgi:hypothetical protein